MLYVECDEHHRSTDFLHCKSDNGDPGNLADMFDGECYASTYQTNGQCHIYQELPELKSRKTSTISNKPMSSFSPQNPLRLGSTSSTFLRSVPDTPSSVFDPEMSLASPYLASRPGTLSKSIDLSEIGSSLPCTPNDRPVSLLSTVIKPLIIILL